MCTSHLIQQAQWHSSPTLSRQVLEFSVRTGGVNIWREDGRQMNCVRNSTCFHLKTKGKFQKPWI